MKTEIKQAYIDLFGEKVFPEIEKGIDEEGWYSNERNGAWLPISNEHLKKIEFNDKKDFRPLSLSNNGKIEPGGSDKSQEPILLGKKNPGITLEQIQQDIKDKKSTHVYYSSRTLWWTHLETDLKEATDTGKIYTQNLLERMLNDPTVSNEKKDEIEKYIGIMQRSHENHPEGGVPTDPTGAPLLMIDNPQKWIDEALAKPDHFGKHQIDAFIKTHHRNGGELFFSWETVNRYIDVEILNLQTIKNSTDEK